MFAIVAQTKETFILMLWRYFPQKETTVSGIQGHEIMELFIKKLSTASKVRHGPMNMTQVTQ